MSDNPEWEIARSYGTDEAGMRRIFELADGTLAVIGTLATSDLEPGLPSDAARAPYEEIVIMPSEALLSAAEQLPEE